MNVTYGYKGIEHSGLTKVLDKNGLWGFIDLNGNYVIPPKYVDINDDFETTDSIVKVMDNKGLYGFIDINGNEVVKPKYAFALSFKEGRAVVHEGVLFGYIDTTGLEITPIQYKQALSFKGGAAIVKTLDDLYGVIGLDGNYIVTPLFLQLSMFFFNRSRVKLDNLKWGFVDNNGIMAVIPAYKNAADYTVHKTALVWNFNRCDGTIDVDGFIIED